MRLKSQLLAIVAASTMMINIHAEDHKDNVGKQLTDTSTTISDSIKEVKKFKDAIIECIHYLICKVVDCGDDASQVKVIENKLEDTEEDQTTADVG